MPSLLRVISLLAPAALFVLGSCTSPLEPGDVAGTYALVRVAGIAMPATVTVEGGMVLQVEYDTLVLRANGSTYFARQYSGAPPSAGLGFAAGDGTFELDGSVIVLIPPAGCNSLVCGVVPRRVRRASGGLRESDAMFGELEFRRISAAP